MRRVLFLAAFFSAAVLLTSCGDNTTTNPGGDNSLSSGTKTSGGTYSKTFPVAGTVTYHCTIHPGCAGLMGTVTVLAAGSNIPPTSHFLAISLNDGGSGCPYSLNVPATTVLVGETVVWSFNSASPHTVTSP